MIRQTTLNFRDLNNVMYKYIAQIFLMQCSFHHLQTAKCGLIRSSSKVDSGSVITGGGSLELCAESVNSGAGGV